MRRQSKSLSKKQEILNQAYELFIQFQNEALLL